MRSLTRRETLLLGVGGAATVSTGWHRDADAKPADATAAIARFTGGKIPESGPITIELPEIAENGSSVSLTIMVDSPMSATDYVSDILVVGEGNPLPEVRAEIAMRIRLAASQHVIAVAKTSNGAVISTQRQVKVTVGGCGG
jgi:sulfur-oxidizing protein SoxY